MKNKISLLGVRKYPTYLNNQVQLRSRRGEGGMIWTILVIAAVVAIAALVLVPVFDATKTLGANAKTDLSKVSFK